MSTPQGSSSAPLIALNSPESDVASTQRTDATVDASLNANEDVDMEAPHDGKEHECEVVIGGKYRSDFWNHFLQIKLNGVVVKAKCKYCSKVLKAESKNGTTALKDHYKHCKKKPQAPGMRQRILTSNFLKGDGKRALEAYSFDHDFARRQLAYMIILHEYPLSIVEHIGFKRFVQSLQPLFKVVSRNTIKNDIFKIYDNEKKKMMQLLEDNQSRVAVTTDMWTSNQKRSYMVVTAHYIDNTWTLQSLIMRFIYVPCPHTAEVLCDALSETFVSWNIDRKLSTLTVDNCSSNDAMIRLLLEKLQPDSLLCGGQLLHMRCAAHILNLIVKDGLEVIKEAIVVIRESVLCWTATPKRQEKFEKAAKQLKLAYDKKLCLDCPTRWNSTFLMLQSAIPYKDVFTRLMLIEREVPYKSCPKESDWELAKKICQKLQIFYNVTELFSGTTYPTANLFFPKICEIKIAMSQWVKCGVCDDNRGDDDLCDDDVCGDYGVCDKDLGVVCDEYVIHHMANKMLTKFGKYWNKIHGILGVAAVLDPRYKMTLLDFYFPKIYGIGHSSRNMIEKIRGYCYELVREYQQKFGQSDGGDGSLESSSRVEDSLSDYDKFVSSMKKQKTLIVKSELDHYLDEDVLPRGRGGNFDILVWWKSNGLKYPTLAAIARDILAIPISTVASEAAFSTGGRVVSPHRNRLNAKTLEALMCTQSWLSTLQEGVDREEFETINNDDDGEDCELSSNIIVGD